MNWMYVVYFVLGMSFGVLVLSALFLAGEADEWADTELARSLEALKEERPTSD